MGHVDTGGGLRMSAAMTSVPPTRRALARNETSRDCPGWWRVSMIVCRRQPVREEKQGQRDLRHFAPSRTAVLAHRLCRQQSKTWAMHRLGRRSAAWRQPVTHRVKHCANCSVVTGKEWGTKLAWSMSKGWEERGRGGEGNYSKNITRNDRRHGSGPVVS